MPNLYRQVDFRLGSVHGKIPHASSIEAQVRNHLYNVGMIILRHKTGRFTKIRLVGYEVPIWNRGKSRDECIDLLGYDEAFRPWIIELKKAASIEKVPKVVSQVNRYAEAFQEIKTPIQAEIRERFFWPDFTFNGEIGKIILADRAFYNQKEIPVRNTDINFCYFARRNEKSLLKGFQNKIEVRELNG